MKSFLQVLSAVAILVLMASAVSREADPTGSAAAEVGAAAATPELVYLHGRLVCLHEEMHRLHKADLPSSHEHVQGFRTTNEVYFTVLHTKLSEALFLDPALKEKELVLKGRVFPKSHVFEPLSIRSVQNGKVHDLFYYCDICDIESVTPAECFCCHGPVRLVEKPL